VNVLITNLSTGVTSKTATNEQGVYRIPSLQPGIYRLTVDKDGFKSIVKSGVELHVQDVASINFELQIGSVNETVTVEAGGLVINTTDASVSAVVGRQFVENMPLNGRRFQSLIQLTPGVVLNASSSVNSGQFSVNGQRSDANYWMVDGVSANMGTTSFPRNGLAGALGSFSATGGTNGLVSVDAMQEFRIETSTYAPEFGRSPGGQISIATRSGTNQFHGSAFDYFRNDKLDANDWFANSAGLPKPEERQNDFGGTVSGPVVKDRTFFFFSYEGLRLRLPQTTLSTVPDLSTRQNALPAVQPFLNAFPQPNGPDDLATGIAQFNASYSNRSTLDAYSIRIDHKLNNRINLFGRYNDSPSKYLQRGGPGAVYALSALFPSDVNTQPATVGALWTLSPQTANDLRFNYSTADSTTRFYSDNFGGAVPVTSVPFVSPYTTQNSLFGFEILSLTSGAWFVGPNARTQQRQINLVDTLAVQKGSHSLKFGVDFRRLSPVFEPRESNLLPLFLTVQSAENGQVFATATQTELGATLLFRNFRAPDMGGR
jgi:hypothetical protein